MTAKYWLFFLLNLNLFSEQQSTFRFWRLSFKEMPPSPSSLSYWVGQKETALENMTQTALRVGCVKLRLARKIVK